MHNFLNLLDLAFGREHHSAMEMFGINPVEKLSVALRARAVGKMHDYA